MVGGDFDDEPALSPTSTCPKVGPGTNGHGTTPISAMTTLEARGRHDRNTADDRMRKRPMATTASPTVANNCPQGGYGMLGSHR